MPGPDPRSSGRVMAGGYRLDAEIARGGHGTVYRAVHAQSGAPAAVKVLHAEVLSDPRSALRFEREARVVLSLSHPGIVKVHECGHTDDGRPYIAMELLAGESLEDLLKRRRTLAAPEVIALLEPLSVALATVHERGIVHRDIKPSNVFLAEGRPEGGVVLLDFGIVKLLDGEGPSLTASRTTLGTLPFMAPEQVRGQPVDIRTDVYALGALAYAMLAGKPPFGLQVTTILRQIGMHARPPPPSQVAGVDPAVDGPILAALSRDPNERPASAPAFVAALRASLRASSPAAGALPEGVESRGAIAVFVDLRPDVGALAAGDEALLDAMEASLTIARAELLGAGLIAVIETSSTLLAISAEPPAAERAAQVLAACAHAYRRVLDGPAAGGAMAISIAVHAGTLHINEAGAILPSALMDVRSWAPRGLVGVAASGAALGAACAGRGPASAEGFYAL